MKKLFLLLAMVSAVTMNASAFTPTKQSCQALYADAIMLQSYVVPCEDMVNPAILQERPKANAVIQERLALCENKFSSSEQELMMDELFIKIEPMFKAWQSQIMTNQPAFCQAQRASLVERLSHYL